MSIRAFFIGFVALSGSLAALAPLSTAQAAGEPVNTFSSWRLFVDGSGAALHCYIVGEPQRSQPRNVKRGDIFFTISHRPGQGVRNEISVNTGYPISASSKPFAQVGSDEYAFFTGVQVQSGADAWSWLQNLDDQPRLVTAMKRGSELIFKATSARGTLTTDSYSLRGVTAAMNALDAACPAP